MNIAKQNVLLFLLNIAQIFNHSTIYITLNYDILNKYDMIKSRTSRFMYTKCNL